MTTPVARRQLPPPDSQEDSNCCLQDENLSEAIRKAFNRKTYEHAGDFFVDFLVSMEKACPDLVAVISTRNR